MAAGLALSFVAELGVKNAILEGDSLLMVKALTDFESSMSHIGPLIDDAKYYSYSFEKLLYSHVTKDCNSVAHSLVKHAHSRLSSVDGGNPTTSFSCTSG